MNDLKFLTLSERTKSQYQHFISAYLIHLLTWECKTGKESTTSLESCELLMKSQEISQQSIAYQYMKLNVW